MGPFRLPLPTPFSAAVFEGLGLRGRTEHDLNGLVLGVLAPRELVSHGVGDVPDAVEGAVGATQPAWRVELVKDDDAYVGLVEDAHADMVDRKVRRVAWNRSLVLPHAPNWRGRGP